MISKKQKPGKSTILVGIQYGDEGKARVLDNLLKLGNYDVVARFNGGANAGHTLEVNNIRISLHQIPSGIFYDKMKLYYGSGCVLDPVKFVKEIKEVEKNKIDLSKRLIISPNVPLVKPANILLDKIHGKKIGTTGNGIGFAYSDICIRILNDNLKNIRLADYLSDPSKFKKHVLEDCEQVVKNNKIKDVDAKKLVSEFHNSVLKLKNFVASDLLTLQKMVDKGKNVFFEGANSIMLDPLMGTTPYVTSSRTLAAAAYTGGDLSCTNHDKAFGIVKAIMSRVGNGPFVTEFGGLKTEDYCKAEGGYKYVKEVENKNYPDVKALLKKDEFNLGIGLRMLGNEYGATTKRPRRIGSLDLVMVKQNVKLNGLDGIFINKMDCLIDFKDSYLKGIPVVTKYKLNGKTIDYMPTSEEDMRNCKPITKYLPFIKKDISEIRNNKKLPKEVLGFIKFVEKEIGVPVLGIGVGPKREQFIMLKKV